MKFEDLGKPEGPLSKNKFLEQFPETKITANGEVVNVREEIEKKFKKVTPTPQVEIREELEKKF